MEGGTPPLSAAYNSRMHGPLSHLPHWLLIRSAWLTFVIVWMIGALRTKRTRARQPHAARAVQLVLGLGIWQLVVNRHYSAALAFLERPVVPDSWLAIVMGYGLLFGGIAFAIAARVSLGRNWSANVTVKEDHQLICTGLYAFVRNPIYTGLTAAVLGTAVVLNAMHAFLAFAIVVPLFVWKTRYEERFMEQEFGMQYAAYRQRVRSFIPFVW
jgi:protein-S-isoprenylcysteine O-methyltransferase Ste14